MEIRVRPHRPSHIALAAGLVEAREVTSGVGGVLVGEPLGRSPHRERLECEANLEEIA